MAAGQVHHIEREADGPSHQLSRITPKITPRLCRSGHNKPAMLAHDSLRVWRKHKPRKC